MPPRLSTAARGPYPVLALAVCLMLLVDVDVAALKLWPGQRSASGVPASTAGAGLQLPTTRPSPSPHPHPVLPGSPHPGSTVPPGAGPGPGSSAAPSPVAVPTGLLPTLLPPIGPPLAAPARFFSPASVFNAPLAPDAPLAAGSSSDVVKLAHQAAYSTTSSPVRGYYGSGYGVTMGVSNYSVPIYTVGTTGVDVAPVTLVDRMGAPIPANEASGLPGQLTAVPVPIVSGQIASGGTDAEVAIYQPATDTMWEFWVFKKIDGPPRPRYTARYGGVIPHVSTASGVLPHDWGARATSLAAVGGEITMMDYLSGAIPHALGIAIPVVARGPVAPATRSDGPRAGVPGGDSRDAVPEGARFRLPPGFDCVAGLPAGAAPLLRMMCVAVRDYGLIVNDFSTTVRFTAEDPRTVGTGYQTVTADVWAPIASRLYGPRSILGGFPWSSLQELAPCDSDPACHPGQVP